MGLGGGRRPGPGGPQGRDRMRVGGRADCRRRGAHLRARTPEPGREVRRRAGFPPAGSAPGASARRGQAAGGPRRRLGDQCVCAHELCALVRVFSYTLKQETKPLLQASWCSKSPGLDPAVPSEDKPCSARLAEHRWTVSCAPVVPPLLVRLCFLDLDGMPAGPQACPASAGQTSQPRQP